MTGVLKSERSDLGMCIDADKIGRENACGTVRAGRIAVERIKTCLLNGVDFTQETTLSGKKTMITVKAARAKGYTVHMYYVGLGSFEESVKRIANRVAKGGHDIARETVKRRYDNRFDNLVKILPYCNRVEFYDNENGLVKVGEYINGELTSGEYVPEWLEEFKSKI